MNTTIAYLGPAGTFTEAALWEFHRLGHLPNSDDHRITPLPVASPREAIDLVREGTADYACVAIENSVDGPVTPTFDAIAAGEGVQIFYEVDLPIAFSMMLAPGTDLAQCRTVTCHPVAYQQVKKWVCDTIGDHEFVPASSNAAGAGLVAEGKADIAAAPAAAATLYGLDIVADQIADKAGARTRFVLVGKQAAPTARTGVDRTAVVFILRNEPGSLVRALTEFSLRGVDLSRIESRPIENGLGTYRFHVDIHGHIADLPVAEALRALYLQCDQISFLGSWPAHDACERVRMLAQDHARRIQAQEWVQGLLER
ncbi:prephenate dehydratase [Corynebacterium felinum]|uniref:Prephenate dehydratase n=1 Tax=Corynebacterium felinum TaxID=131318 RepID=A0ABU2B621_9CORY|nr:MULTISPECIES: prephenate dehydratase [Corynebacterium]MDF5820809.1 prephenate dehydratase [Corynebacterium felinum]MDO4762229.1 prephenate dehydratase [Corynebacterium sp.]MDR7354075.1 prephenate dehydratase [Corynebacterium felinum]WJY96247.1 Prephenate dehydratase [Corynebacterium felinum]